MEEIQESLSQEDQKRKVTIYSPEMKIRLLDEYKKVSNNISASQFARDHDISNSTFFGWLGKAGITTPLSAKVAVDVRSMIQVGNRNKEPAVSPTIPKKSAETKPTMIPIMINGNEIMTTPEGVGIIAESLKLCSR